MKIKFKRLHPNAVIPIKATSEAACHDVVVTEIEKVSDDFVICKLGFALGLPKGYKLVLVPRSSLTKTKWILQNSPGQGDEDFLFEYSFRFRALPQQWNTMELSTGNVITTLSYPEFPYSVGDRIGQIFIEKVIPIEFEEVEDLGQTKRLGGYGSTGVGMLENTQQ